MGDFPLQRSDRAVSAGRIRASSSVVFRNALIPAAAVLACALAAGASAAPAAGPATTALSSSKAGAKHVTLTVAFRTELQCGRLMGSRTLAVTLPAKVKLPATVAPVAVTVSGRAVSSVAVAGRAVTITLPAPRGMMCDSITMGLAKIVFLPAAGLGNPRAPGIYTVRVVHGGEAFAAPLKIHA
jgi:hypothetical protein